MTCKGITATTLARLIATVMAIGGVKANARNHEFVPEPKRTLVPILASGKAFCFDTIIGPQAPSCAVTNSANFTRDLEEALDLANAYAPEHLCLAVREPWKLAERVSAAGGVFVGEHSFEVLGDYTAGPSHVMPTGGSARFSSPVNVWDFVKLISLVALDPQTAAQISRSAARLADALTPDRREEAFIAGLLADIGIVILDEAMPTRYRAITEQYKAGGNADLAVAENALLDTNHGQVSAMVLDHWKLPQAVCEAVRWHPWEMQEQGKDPLAEAGHKERQGDLAAAVAMLGLRA